ncbi:hypothetical protein [Lentibacter sp.]
MHKPRIRLFSALGLALAGGALAGALLSALPEPVASLSGPPRVSVATLN